MTEKRFERIYADVDVFCRDHNAKGVSQLIERDDYDKIVERFNALHEEIEQLKDVNTQCCNDYSAMRRDVLQYKKENKQLKQQLFETRKDYILETYADNPVRRDEKLKALEKELKGDFE